MSTKEFKCDRCGAELQDAGPVGLYCPTPGCEIGELREGSLRAALRALRRVVGLPEDATQEQSEIRLRQLLQAESDLRFVDEILSRRPALDGLPDRFVKIEKAINTAKRVDELELKIAQQGKT